MDLFDRLPRNPRKPGDARGAGGRDGARPPEETIEGIVERIVFTGGGGEFTVARLAVAVATANSAAPPDPGGAAASTTAPGDSTGEPVTIVGSLLGIPVGARLRITGHRETNPRFGPQFRVASYTELAPETVEGIRRYLGSGLIKGIGPEFAARIVARFGIDTLEILDRDPARISEVPGIGPTRARSIRQAWTAQREVRKVMVFLQGYGVSPAFAARIYKRYGAAAIAEVRANPYRLAFDIWGIGFLSADKLASSLGIAHDADVRVEGGVRHVLEESASGGDVYVPRERLTDRAAALLGVEHDLVRTAIDRLARQGDVAIDLVAAGEQAARGANVMPDDDTGGEAVYDTPLYRAEVAGAAGLRRLLDVPATTVSIDLERALAWYEAESNITLAPQQAAAIRGALRDKVMVVTGGPGVGKTTIVRGIVAILGKKGLRVALAAPTGRAAKRLSESTGQPAATLHRLMEWRPADAAFGRNADRPLDADLLVVDEASMLDVRLFADLTAALAPSTRLLLVGDVDQLPSVGPGTVLRDVIASGVVPTVRLTQIFRQASESLIVVNAHRIHDGELPDLGAPPAEGAGADRRDFFFLEEDDPARAAATVRDLVTARLPRRYALDPHEIQVLCPMHRGELGAGNLNALMQAALTPDAPGLTRGGRTLRVGDRVMQIRNDYDKDVFNGDVGRVVALDAGALASGGGSGGGGGGGGTGAATGNDSDAAGGDGLVVRFDDREVRYELDELDELQLAYAATVHKSQGSEYPAVVIPIHTQHYVMLQRNLLYTAVTRARRLVVLVGTRKALSLAVRNANVTNRCSRLAARIAASVA